MNTNTGLEGNLCVISSSNTDNGKIYKWQSNAWTYLFKLNSLSLDYTMTNADGTIVAHGGTSQTCSTTNYNPLYVKDTDKMYKILLQNSTQYNDMFYKFEGSKIHLKAIGKYQISYNVFWKLNEDDCHDFLEANKLGMFTFCHLNDQFVNTSMAHMSGNSFSVNSHNSFIVDNLVPNSILDLYYYKIFAQYEGDVTLDNMSTSVTAKYLV